MPSCGFSSTPAQGFPPSRPTSYCGRREREAVCGRVTPLFRRCQKSAQWPTGGPPGARLGPDSGREEAEEEAGAPDDRELGAAALALLMELVIT